MPCVYASLNPEQYKAGKRNADSQSRRALINPKDGGGLVLRSLGGGGSLGEGGSRRPVSFLSPWVLALLSSPFLGSRILMSRIRLTCS